jgi:Cyclin D1 binding domain
MLKDRSEGGQKGSHQFHSEERRRLEFFDLEPSEISPLRRERLHRDENIRSQFVRGNSLWDLRAEMDDMASKLVKAINAGKNREEDVARQALRSFEQRDPELVYMRELADMEQATLDGRAADANSHREKAIAARSCLPQFNLDGLWVGKYGSHGYELINVTYVGDTLVATKVTGDKNVPRGEVSFAPEFCLVQLNEESTCIVTLTHCILANLHSGLAKLTFKVDLLPLHHSVPIKANQHGLTPIQLTEKAARKWGTMKLARYSGQGHVAEEGFQNNQWMEGQLIIIGDEYFSFAWIPIENQIFFGRPSPELALKLLRESGVEPLRLLAAESFSQPPSLKDNLDLQKRFVCRMLEATNEMEDELNGDSFGCIWNGESTDECYFE